MQCRISTTSGRAQLSSLHETDSPRHTSNHAYLSVVRLAPTAMNRALRSDRQATDHSRAVQQLVNMQSSSRNPAAARLLGSLPAPSRDALSEAVHSTARLDAAWHLAALPKARGLTSTSATHPPLVPAAAQCFSTVSTTARAAPLMASASVSPAASDSVTSITADFVLTAPHAVASFISGLTARPAAFASAASPQHTSEQASKTTAYCTQWQAAAPEKSCSAAATASLQWHAAASAACLMMSGRRAIQASASALAVMQQLDIRRPSGRPCSVDLLSGSADSSPGEALAALLRSAALEQGAQLSVGCYSQDALRGNRERRAASTRLSISVAAAMAGTQAGHTSSPHGTRSAAGVQHIPRLLHAVASKDASELAVALGTVGSSSGEADEPCGGSFWVTGGLGALGLAAAGWLLAVGATQLQLVGRSVSGLTTELQRRLSALLQYAPDNAVVVIRKGDVSAREDLCWWPSNTSSPLTGACGL